MTIYFGTQEFQGATFVKTSFRGATMRSCDVSGVTMRRVDVGGLDIDSHDVFFASLISVTIELSRAQPRRAPHGHDTRLDQGHTTSDNDQSSSG